MSAPGNTNPIGSSDSTSPLNSPVTKKTQLNKDSSWQGRKANDSTEPSSESSLARNIISGSNSPTTGRHSPAQLRMKSVSRNDSTLKNINPHQQTTHQVVTELANLINIERNKANVWLNKSNSKPDYSKFLNHEHLFDALGELLIKNKGNVSTDTSTLDFLKEFEGCVEKQANETILRVATRLINDKNPATNAFLYLCRNTEAFRTIVKEMLPYDKAFDFVCLYATKKEAETAVIHLLKSRKETLPAFFYTTETHIFTDSELLEIGKEIGEMDLLQRFINAKNSKIETNLITQLLRFPTQKNITEISALLEYNLPITPNMLRGCLMTRHFRGIEMLLMSSRKEFIIESREAIFDALMACRDPLLGDLIAKHAPDLATMVSKRELIASAKHGNDWFFDWTVNNGRKINPSEAAEMLPLSIQSGNLSLIKRLFDTPGDDGITPLHKYPDDLGLDKKEQKDKEHYLLRFALFSPLEEVYALAGKYPDFADILKETLDLLPLLVRFPSLQYTVAIGNRLTPVRYVNQTRQYARENLKAVNHLLPLLKHNISREELLTLITADRYGRLSTAVSQKIKIAYREFRKDPLYATFFCKTQIYDMVTREVTATGASGSKIVSVVVDTNPGRYAWCLKHLNEMCYDDKTNEWTIPSDTSMEMVESTDYGGKYINEIRYSYPLTTIDGSLNPLLTTTLKPQLMNHTPQTTLKEIQNHVEELQKEILTYNLNFTDSKNLKLFYEKVARGYWLIATLCETVRGTPHNAMIWLNLMYEHHKLPPPIPKIDHFFLDNTMLVTPVEKAIENWESYFESPLDVSLKKTHGDTWQDALRHLLEINGDLLKLCSFEVRDNKELVDLAVRTTPSAKQYASNRIRNA